MPGDAVDGENRVNRRRRRHHYVRDLFYATPARLKFKTDRSEAVREVVRRLAMSRPDVAFTPAGEDRAPVTWAAASDELARLGDVLGPDFRANAMTIDAAREGVRLQGFAALPTLSRANTLGQYLFVNGRPVRDKVLVGAVRGAYADYLPRDRHPLLPLFVTLEPREVDVNVHPAKTEVRFRDGGLVRGLIVRALKEACARSHAASTGGATLARSARSRRGRRLCWRRLPSRPGFVTSEAAAFVAERPVPDVGSRRRCGISRTGGELIERRWRRPRATHETISWRRRATGWCRRSHAARAHRYERLTHRRLGVAPDPRSRKRRA